MIYINENKRHNNHCRLFILLFNNLVEKVGISLDVTLFARVFQGRFLQIGGKGTEFIVHVFVVKNDSVSVLECQFINIRVCRVF